MKRKLGIAVSIVTGVSTIAGIWGYTVRDFFPGSSWWENGLALLCGIVVITLIIYVINRLLWKRPYKTKINGQQVTIRIGDLFEETASIVIPFNERYDTKVDDIVISKSSLNGKVITKIGNSGVNELKQLIEKKAKEIQKHRGEEPGNGTSDFVFPLGTIIPYKKYMFLAFAHVDEENRAYIGVEEYEMILLQMWKGIRNSYAGNKVVLPLIGTGITDIEGVNQKDYTQMLKCILCSLRISGFQFVAGIDIILTSEAMKKINMDLIKAEF